MNTRSLERSITLLPDVVKDVRYAELLARVAFAKAVVGEMERRIKTKMVEQIKSTGRDIVIEVEGEKVRYFVGKKKTTKCRDAKKLLKTFVESFSIEDLESCLSSGAFKHGACKTVLKDTWDEHFVIETKDVLEDEPYKALQSIDTRFIK